MSHPTTHPAFEELVQKVKILPTLGFTEREVKAIQASLRITGDLVTHTSPFMCGIAGSNDKMGLPDFVLVCPAHGLSGFFRYKKDGEYSEPGY